VVGVALAVLIVESRLLEKSMYALIVGLNSVPKVAVAPLFVIWLGTDAEPKIAIVVGAIVGEFVSSQRGLGYVILSAQGNFDTARVFAALLVLAVMGVLLFWFVARAERLAIPWHASQKEYIPTA